MIRLRGTPSSHKMTGIVASFGFVQNVAVRFQPGSYQRSSR